MTTTLLSRYRGTMLGVHAGDALGAPYEKREPQVIEEDLDARGGLVPFDYEDPWGRSGIFPAGRPTDDTELTAALAASLLSQGMSRPDHQFRVFRRVAIEGQSLIWEGPAQGFGGTTKRMLRPETYKESQKLAFARDDHLASNGSLMRSAPLALFYRGRHDELMRAARESSRVTHMHDVSVECCFIFVRMLDALLEGASPQEAWNCGRSILLCCPDVQSFAGHREVPEPESTNQWPPHGSALHTLHVAVWAFRTAESFEDGIERAIRKAGDTDTTAAVAGALLGAHFGIGGIPEDWLDALQGRERMDDFARRLYAVSEE